MKINSPKFGFKRKYTIILLIIAYLWGLFTGEPYYTSLLAGLLLIMVTLLSLEKFRIKESLLILSHIIIYPLYIGITKVIAHDMENYITQNVLGYSRFLLVYPSNHPLIAFAYPAIFFIISILYAIVYAFIYKNYWTWIAKELQKTLFISMIIIVASTLPILLQRWLRPGINGQFFSSEALFAQQVAAGGPVFIAIVLIISYFCYKSKENKLALHPNKNNSA